MLVNASKLYYKSFAKMFTEKQLQHKHVISLTAAVYLDESSEVE